MRSVFNVPMSGAGADARHFLICVVFLAAPLVTLDGAQIGMEEFQARIPPRPRWWLQLGIEVAGIAFFAYMAMAAAVTISNNLRNQTATLEMPFWLFMAPLVVGMALLSLETFMRLRRTWQRKRLESTVLT
jgi:TRAP-type C4-dicarboxylate transport system permease small subunit